MNVRDAAVHVLREAEAPLHAEELTRSILSGGLWQTESKTPTATVAAVLYTDIKTRREKSPFVRVGPQTFGLREWGTEPSPVAQPPSAKNATKPSGIETATGPTQAAHSTGKYSFTDAAEKVLEQFGQKRPMHYRAITAKALELGWIATESRTPEATMYAQIFAEIRRRQQRDEQPRFVQHGRGFVGLSRWMGKGLAFEIEQHNKRVRQSLHKRVLSMQPGEFEELIGELLAKMGFEDIEVTGRSGDGGVDVRGTLVVGDVVRIRMAVQAKKWQPKSRVQAPVVQQVRGSLGTHEQGLIITTSDFSAGAREEAARPNAVPVALMNGEQLMALLAQYEIGLTRQTYGILEMDEQHSAPEPGAP